MRGALLIDDMRRAASAGGMIILGLAFYATDWAVAVAAVWILVLFAILIDGGAKLARW
jgi:hypothetical protein